MARQLKKLEPSSVSVGGSACIPRISLGHWPTPLSELPRLSEHLGVNLDIKRDDLTGLALGGNKTRKLEFILGQALNEGCDTVITAGAAQSNHCRQTAAAAAVLGLECHLVLGGSEPETSQGNLLLDELLGAHIHWAGGNRKGEDIPNIARTLSDTGRTPYVVPYGGSNALGALAYCRAVDELDKQASKKYSHIIFASSSGGTHAGLSLGNARYGCASKVVGINIDKVESDTEFSKRIVDMANEAAELINSETRVRADDIHLNNEYLGEGYGVVGDAEREAIKLMANREGILLDPVYSGRAFAGLIDMVQKGEIPKGADVLFWHTGGAPALFAYSNSVMSRGTLQKSS